MLLQEPRTVLPRDAFSLPVPLSLRRACGPLPRGALPFFSLTLSSLRPPISLSLAPHPQRAAHLPVNHGEAFNVLRYGLDQHYASHYDTFDPESYGPQPSQRMLSVLVYLSEWESGGESSSAGCRTFSLSVSSEPADPGPCFFFIRTCRGDRLPA